MGLRLRDQTEDPLGGVGVTGPVEPELSPSQSKADPLRASELLVMKGVLVLKMGKCVLITCGPTE